jgi:hypothetical protein
MCYDSSFCVVWGCRPLDEAAEILRALQDKLRFVIVTSRQLIIEDITKAWVERHYGGIFEDVLLANHYSVEGPQRFAVSVHPSPRVPHCVLPVHPPPLVRRFCPFPSLHSPALSPPTSQDQG